MFFGSYRYTHVLIAIIIFHSVCPGVADPIISIRVDTNNLAFVEFFGAFLPQGPYLLTDFELGFRKRMPT